MWPIRAYFSKRIAPAQACCNYFCAAIVKGKISDAPKWLDGRAVLDEDPIAVAFVHQVLQN